MRKYKFKVVESYLKIFKKVNDEVYELLNKKDADVEGACIYLEKIQQKAIELGEFIEKEEGETGAVSVIKTLEEFCEVLYEIHEELLSERGLAAQSAKGRLEHAVNSIERAAKEDIVLTRVAVFLPYKATMWDSLESVWLAARADENCEAYVIPIPYYDRNPDMSFGTMHYEADLFPDYVPITNYEDFDFGLIHPDMIFIHNPYDKYNYVTSVHPFFYSEELKKHTDCLVYIPYFATTGGMGAPQAYMPSYDVVDFIVVQSSSLKAYYTRVSQDKILPLGSPKFDAVIRRCQNPPEPPEDWKAKMAGKKVYFFNTSLNGMLENPEVFMKKMEYVFDTFRDRKDVCLLWRPHPLFESTMESMVPEILPVYRDIRDKYIAEGWGIYDTTPSIENTIALCDVYVGDANSSVTSLFGVAGKPVFVLNNRINTLPSEDDWTANVRQDYFENFDGKKYNKYCLLFGNKLFWSPKDDMHFEFFCDLPMEVCPWDYGRAIEHNGKVVLIPINAQDILIIDKNKNIKKVELEKHPEIVGPFWTYFIDGNYVFLIPRKYPCLIRFDMNTGELAYLSNVGGYNIGVTEEREEIPNATWMDKENIYMLSGTGQQMLVINKKSLEVQEKQTGFAGLYWSYMVEEYGSDEVWLNPFFGTVWKRYNFKTGATKDFDVNVEGFFGVERSERVQTNKRLFWNVAFNGDELIFAPYWGNKFISLDRKSGKATEWDGPFESGFEHKSQYKWNDAVGGFCYHWTKGEAIYLDYMNRKLYNLNLATKEISPLEEYFDKDEVYEHCLGYANQARNLTYMCNENEFNTLADLLDDNISGNKQSTAEQLEAYKTINASPAGDCGEKVYEYLK